MFLRDGSVLICAVPRRGLRGGDGFGMGLGGLPCAPIAGNAKPPPGSLGEFKWDGASGCYMVIDRKQETFFVLLGPKLLVHETMAN